MIVLIVCWMFTMLYVAPCWILAVRKGISPSWYHWIIPFWNFFVAFKVGKGSLRLLALSLLLAFVLGIVLFTASGVTMGLLMLVGSGVDALFSLSGAVLFCVLLALASYCVYIFAIWQWSKNISELAGVDPMILGVMLVVLPTLVPLLCNVTMFAGTISPLTSTVVSQLSLLASWITFMTIAIRTPKVTLQAETQVIEE